MWHVFRHTGYWRGGCCTLSARWRRKQVRPRLPVRPRNRSRRQTCTPRLLLMAVSGNTRLANTQRQTRVPELKTWTAPVRLHHAQHRRLATILRAILYARPGESSARTTQPTLLLLLLLPLLLEPQTCLAWICVALGLAKLPCRWRAHPQRRFHRRPPCITPLVTTAHRVRASRMGRLKRPKLSPPAQPNPCAGIAMKKCQRHRRSRKCRHQPMRPRQQCSQTANQRQCRRRGRKRLLHHQRQRSRRWTSCHLISRV